jgi:hypothetical protein
LIGWTLILENKRALMTVDMLDTNQRYMSSKIIKWKALLLAAQMGSGKTAACLDAAKKLLNEFLVRRVLVIGPKRVATDTWPDEVSAWAHLRNLSVAVAVGTPAERLLALARKAEITTINRENFVWLYKIYEAAGIEKWPFDMVIWDESSSLASWDRTRIKKEKVKVVIKGAERTRTKETELLTRFGALARVQPYVKYMVLLSGTPASRGLIDLGGQIYILDEGERLGREKGAFLGRWFESDYMGWAYTPRPWAEKEIMDRVQDIMVSIKPTLTDDRLIPRFVDVWVKLSPALKREYRAFARTMVAEAYDVEAVSSGVLAGKLLQFANGGLYKEKELRQFKKRNGEYDERWERDVAFVHDLKLDALESVIEESGGRNILVAYSFKFDKDAILARLGKRYGIRCIGEEKNGIRDWNAGKVRIALVHCASIGHGTNLQYGGSIACWFGLTWSAELYDQFNMRLPRRGQIDYVTIYRILCEGTLDEKVSRVLEEKANTQDRITRAVQVELEEMERALAT